MKMMAAMQIKLEAVEGLQEDVATLQADVKSIKVGKNQVNLDQQFTSEVCYSSFVRQNNDGLPNAMLRASHMHFPSKRLTFPTSMTLWRPEKAIKQK